MTLEHRVTTRLKEILGRGYSEERARKILRLVVDELRRMRDV